MEFIEDDKISVVEDGKKIEYDILFTFECEENGKTYIGYSDNKIDDSGRKNILVSSIDPVYGSGELENITDMNEMEMVNEVLEEIYQESSK